MPCGSKDFSATLLPTAMKRTSCAVSRITTLPQKNGYTLVLDLLKATPRPVIVVYTNVIEPRITKDLLLRGVDDVLSKPVHGAFLAGKVRALADKRAAERDARPVAAALEPDYVNQALPFKPEEGLPISFTHLNKKLAGITSVLPVSSAAIDVFEMTRGYDWEVSHIAAAIQRDASLTADVLKLANSHLYNPVGKHIFEVDQAVMRIGQNRVGELALAASALAKTTPEMLPWLDLETTWRRSMASGIAMELLVEAGGHQSIEEGLLLSAIMYPLGRVALGMLFTKEYEEMVALCQKSGESLQEQERRALPTGHVQVMSHLLASWNVPPHVFLPLKFASDEYSALVRLSEPLRTRAELVKVAIALGRLAVGNWHSWDLVQLPSSALLKRLGISDITGILEETKADLAKLAEFSLHEKADRPMPESPKQSRAVNYCSLAVSDQDLLPHLLAGMGLQPNPCSLESLDKLNEPVIVNCLSVSPKRLAALALGDHAIVVTTQEKREGFNRLATTAALPVSYSQLRDALVTPIVKEAAEPTGDRRSWTSRIARSALRSKTKEGDGQAGPRDAPQKSTSK
jgi:HD-like signal output (HDOD) protein